MSRPYNTRSNRKSSRTNITSPLSDIGISTISDPHKNAESVKTKLAHGDTIKETEKKNAIDENDENSSGGTIPASSSSSKKHKQKGKQSTSSTKKATTTRAKKSTTSTKKKQDGKASEKKSQKKAAAKEAAKTRRAELEKDKDYRDAHDELQRLKVLFDLKELDPVRGQKCILDEFRKMTGLKESFAEYDKEYGEESMYHQDLSIMENIVHSFVKAVDFNEALIIIFLHFPTLNIVKTSLEKSDKSDKCFQSATINLILKTIMLILKANDLLSKDFDLAKFNMLLFDINPVKSEAQAFKGVKATDKYEKIPEKCRPESLKSDEDYAKFRHDTDTLLLKMFKALIEKARNKVFIVEHGAWTRDFAKDLADATKVIVESCCHPHKMLSLFATEKDIRQIFRTYTALFRLADGEERIWPTEDELNSLTRFWAAGAILPQCMEPGSPEYDQWIETLPQCMKDSEQFLKWLESAPQGVPKNSPEYIKWIIESPLKDSPDFCEWYLNLIMSLPQCFPPGSPEYDQWKETLPQCMKDSEQFVTWLESAPQGVPKNSPEYIKWIMESPLKDSPDFCKWYLNLIMSLPQCSPKDSKKFQDWINSNAASMPKDSPEFLKWYKNRFGREYSDSPVFTLRQKLAKHREDLEQKSKTPNTPAMRPNPGSHFYPVASFLHCPPPFYQSHSSFSHSCPPPFYQPYSGFSHYPPPFYQPYSGFPHPSQTVHYPMQSAPLPAQQLTDQEKSQYGEPLDTFFHTERILSEEKYDDGSRFRPVHIFRDPQDKIFNGVYFNKGNKKYAARIKIDRCSTRLGLFTLESDAAKTYDDYAILMNRSREERARYKLNFQNECEYISARNEEIVRNRKNAL